MRIDYHDLHFNQFEDLAVAICKVLLGASTQKFSVGPDGGRDGRFSGTANYYPSQADPTAGDFIIQAKHTDNPIGKMSDSDFYSDSISCLIEKEKKRIKDLIKAGEVEHYILFTNRRDSANKTVEIEQELKGLGLKSAKVYGTQNIDMFIKQFSEVLSIADIEFMDSPLRVIPDELAEIILLLKEEIKNIDSTNATQEELKRTAFYQKCDLNNMSDEYQSMILQKYLKEFYKIDDFLAMPANEELQYLYIETAEEFDAEIMERINKVKIDSLLNDLMHRLFYRDIDLKRNRRLTRTVIYYMFWKCDIGVEE